MPALLRASATLAAVLAGARADSASCRQAGVGREHTLLQLAAVSEIRKSAAPGAAVKPRHSAVKPSHGAGEPRHSADPRLTRKSVELLTPSPCEEHCACWTRMVDGHDCGARIVWGAGESGDKALSKRRVRDEFPHVCSCSVGDVLFEQVGGVCRGANIDDNDQSYYRETQVESLQECEVACLEAGSCRALEFSEGDGRCELWRRAVEATLPASGHVCSRVVEFEPVDGGLDRACRGEHTGDNDGDYYELREVTSLAECKAACLNMAACQGIEFSAYTERCELWTRVGGIRAARPALGHLCLRLRGEPDEQAMPHFEPVNGGEGRACRGADAEDNDASYYQVTQAGSLEHCKSSCIDMDNCMGVEFSASGRCELWTRAGGISASRPAKGHSCHRLPMLVEPNGERACEGEGCCGGRGMRRCAQSCPPGYELRCVETEAAVCSQHRVLRTRTSLGQVCCGCQRHVELAGLEPCRRGCPCWQRLLPGKIWSCGSEIYALEVSGKHDAAASVLGSYPETCTCSL
mmetsp:Transcript_33456/g.77721  ORF Transcript_33456/g.77721 Transcript_33456/m.77721 type:complete len:521 (+) Transcript_33456:47-1609(+)